MLLISLSQGVLQSQVILFRRLHVAAAPFTVTPFFFSFVCWYKKF